VLILGWIFWLDGVEIEIKFAIMLYGIFRLMLCTMDICCFCFLRLFRILIWHWADLKTVKGTCVTQAMVMSVFSTYYFKNHLLLA